MLTFLFSQLALQKPFYNQGFYVLYCAVSVADLSYVVITYITYRIPLLGILVDNYRGWDLGAKLFYEGTSYTVWFQACAHTVIAFNRFTAFCLKRTHTQIWSGKPLVIILACLCVSPLIGMSVQMSTPVSYIFTADGQIAATFRDKNINQAVKIVGACYYLPLSIVSFTLNVMAVQRYRRYVKGISDFKTKGHNQEFRFLVHSIFMLCVQVMRVFYYAILFISPVFVKDTAEFTGFMQANLFFISDSYSLLGSVFLFGLSSIVRRDYIRFYNFRRKKANTTIHVTNVQTVS
ncbi:serpentine type 7TM GPCR chemoreceptor srv domain-containing protein [Ditylenchus destructor]|uniref:Serpentine type 7TM GPCR chemoreceptor srv domain-containing protein n=1 Tax=Ditylenchus destructor TaxID=166010 RepID=A0AAD4R7I9_9BILA|nr:serpentine type 7TM GPCR chemoreceptor srv domain-containing protein [Ditylenchus destructor]